MVSSYPAVLAWPPSRYSRPLSTPYASAVDPLLPAIKLAWRLGMGYPLDDWQVEQIRAPFELCPEGHPRAGKLRYRQVLISLGRQNGKTEIAAAMGILVMLLKTIALVIGIASTAEQARIVYTRTLQVIQSNEALKKRFARLTDTRGISTKTGGRYELKAAKGAALQGLPIDLGLVDEVHLLSMELWTALVNGTGGRDNCLVIGITTAGDEDSKLLIHLYKLAESGTADETFGFWIWEAPESRVPESDDELAYFLKCANPALALGRIPIENVIADVRSMPEPDVIRYRLNRFVAAVQGFIPPTLWRACATGEMPEVPREGAVFSIDRTPDWSYASITATWKSEGKLATELVASFNKPSLEELDAVCCELATYNARAFVMDGYALKALAVSLKMKGLPVSLASMSDVITASSLFYSKVLHREVMHPGDQLLTVQIPVSRRKNVGEHYRVARADGAASIDAVMSTVLGVYFAETLPDIGMQLFT